MFTDEQIAELRQNLRPDVIKERRQGSANLSYVEGHYVIRRANDIFGFGGWTRQTLTMEKVVEQEYTSRNGKKGTLVAYIAQVQVRVRVGDELGEWVATDGFGYGEGIDYTNPGQAHEGAVKEAETDAMKRALIKFGDQFGLALYDKERKHVGREEQGHEEQPPGNGQGARGAFFAKLREWAEANYPEIPYKTVEETAKGWMRKTANVDSLSEWTDNTWRVIVNERLHLVLNGVEELLGEGE